MPRRSREGFPRPPTAPDWSPLSRRGTRHRVASRRSTPRWTPRVLRRRSRGVGGASSGAPGRDRCASRPRPYRGPAGLLSMDRPVDHVPTATSRQRSGAGERRTSSGNCGSCWLFSFGGTAGLGAAQPARGPGRPSRRDSPGGRRRPLRARAVGVLGAHHVSVGTSSTSSPTALANAVLLGRLRLARLHRARALRAPPLARDADLLDPAARADGWRIRSSAATCSSGRSSARSLLLAMSRLRFPTGRSGRDRRRCPRRWRRC